MTRERVLIAGCGYVGTALGERLINDGHDVVGLRRTTPRPGIVPMLAADLNDAAALRRALAAADQPFTQLVYAASAGGRDESNYRLAYVDGLATVLDVLTDLDSAPRRTVFLSSTGVYERSDGGWVDEESSAEPAHFSGRLLRAGEQIAIERANAVVLRLAGIYGPTRTRLIRSVWDGTARRTTTASYTNRIHRDDCAGAVAHLLQLESPPPPNLYIGVDEEPVEKNVVIEHLAEELGVRVPPTESVDSARGPRGHKRCRGDLLRKSGYRFKYPTFREGYAELVAELRSQGAGDGA